MQVLVIKLKKTQKERRLRQTSWFTLAAPIALYSIFQVKRLRTIFFLLRSFILREKKYWLKICMLPVKGWSETVSGLKMVSQSWLRWLGETIGGGLYKEMNMESTIPQENVARSAGGQTNVKEDAGCSWNTEASDCDGKPYRSSKNLMMHY